MESLQKSYNTLGLSILILLLLSLETFMESEFTCPSNSELSKWYGAVAFVMPSLALGIMGYKLSGVMKCRVSFRCVMKTAYGPLLWNCIILADGRYATCFVTSHEDAPDAKHISQIVGISLISLLLILSFTMEDFCCCSPISKFYNRQKYEEKMIERLEEGLKNIAEKSETEFADGFIEIITDESFGPHQTTWLENLQNRIDTEKNNMKERFKENTIVCKERHKQAADLKPLLDGKGRNNSKRRASI